MSAYAEIPVTPEALGHVFAHLWPRGREELRRLGLSLTDAYQSFLEWSRSGRSGALAADGVPVMVSGIHPDEDGTFFTWMTCSDDFDAHAKAITRTLRRELAKHEGTVYIYSVCVHPEAERFFRVLGFVRDGWIGRTPMGFPLYRFARSNASKLGRIE